MPCLWADPQRSAQRPPFGCGPLRSRFWGGNTPQRHSEAGADGATHRRVRLCSAHAGVPPTTAAPSDRTFGLCSDPVGGWVGQNLTQASPPPPPSITQQCPGRGLCVSACMHTRQMSSPKSRTCWTRLGPGSPNVRSQGYQTADSPQTSRYHWEAEAVDTGRACGTGGG